MPGEFALRGGILDVYPPESDRPVRVELFGDEVESIRKFDPADAALRCCRRRDACSCPLTETPVREELSPPSMRDSPASPSRSDEETIEQRLRAPPASPFFPVGRCMRRSRAADERFFDLMPNAAVLPRRTRSRSRSDSKRGGSKCAAKRTNAAASAISCDRKSSTTPRKTWAARVERTSWRRRRAARHRDRTGGEDISSPHAADDTLPWLGCGHDRRGQAPRRRWQAVSCSRVASTGEVERLADVFNEYNLSFRIGSRTPDRDEVYVDEAAYLRREMSATTIVKAYVPEGVALPDAESRPLRRARSVRRIGGRGRAAARRQKSKVSAFLSDFRDLAVGDYVVHVEHGIGQYQGLKEIPQDDGGTAEFMILEYAEGARLYVPLTRLDLVQKYRSSEGAKPLLSRLGTQQWQRPKLA